MIALWHPHRSPHIGRALVPAPTALARYSAASGHDAIGVAHAQHAASQGDQQHDDQDSKGSAHISQMAATWRTDQTFSRGLV